MGPAFDIIYLFLLVLCSPILMYRAIRLGKYRDGFVEKVLGRSPRRIGDRPCVWFHAVSVGEVLLLKPIVAELTRRGPDRDIVISTTTPTGLSVARRTYPDIVTFYAPLDLSWAVRRAIARIRPTVLALVELEVWPNLVREAKRNGVGVLIINGRLSARSHRGYRRLRGPLGPTFKRLDAVAAQTPEYAARFVDLGVPADRVRVTGSVKFDNLEADRENPITLSLQDELGLSENQTIFVAGSTMEGEEEAAYSAYLAARREYPELRLILVPRHPERCDRIAAMIEKRGGRVVRRSGGPIDAQSLSSTNPPVILIDTVGELSAIWGLARIAFVGGSLFPGRGGQNMMEPAAYGASVIFGPHTTNFRRPAEQLLERRGARCVKNERELTAALLDDLRDPESIDRRGQAARTFVTAQRGAAARTLAEIDRLLDNGRSDGRQANRPDRDKVLEHN
jgi:3-deoxy-D-manno-octulosonic-acid transferase